MVFGVERTDFVGSGETGEGENDVVICASLSCSVGGVLRPLG